jgi:hypothetical protein
MKKTNIKILFLLSALLSVFIFASTAQASGNSLYVSPATSTINAGSTIIASVIAGTSGDKICAVQGTLVFNNLTCQNISLASGVMAQTLPTCSSPSFVIGIPKCTTTDAPLFTVSAEAAKVGTASISFSGVNLVGVGASVGTSSIASNYTVNSSSSVQITIGIANQPAGIAGASGIIGLSATVIIFGKWLLANIIWIIVLILATGSAYIWGRTSCKRSNKYEPFIKIRG